jgi:hypothetical protein
MGVGFVRGSLGIPPSAVGVVAKRLGTVPILRRIDCRDIAASGGLDHPRAALHDGG